MSELRQMMKDQADRLTAETKVQISELKDSLHEHIDKLVRELGKRDDQQEVKERRDGQ